MPKLIATKGFRYATRRMVAGDEFAANNRDARLLVAIGKARHARVLDAPPAAVVQKVRKVTDPLDHDNDGAPGGSKAPAGDRDALNKLRADYTEVLGKKPFPGWDAAELQRRIDEALAS
jgi:hypothetical protein